MVLVKVCEWEQVIVVSGGREVGVVMFQTGEVATTESLLDTGVSNIPTLTQVTLLVHLRLRRVTSHIPLLNYAVQGSNEELFVELVPKKKDMHVQCCGGLVSEPIKFKRRMFKWQHICVSLNLDTRELRVIYDDLEYLINLKVPETQLESRKLEVRPGGRLVVGQKLYSMEGDFIVLETLDGEVGDWRLYDTALDQAQMRELVRCREVPGLRAPIIDLWSGDFKIMGPTVARNTSLQEICGEKSAGFFLFFNQKMPFERAHSWCRKLQGNLILPEDTTTNTYFFDKFVSYKDQCDDIWTHLYWIGSGGNLETREWLKLTDKTLVTWHPFLREYKTVTPEFQCIAVVTHDRYKWAACPCEIETCILCNFTSHPVMRLRGLCKDTTFDREFSFRDNINMELVFDGLSHVVMEKNNTTWIMRSRLYPELNARMISQWDGQFPVGVHQWVVEGDRCRQKTIELLLTPCRKDEYTCDDGTCIDKTKRCNLNVDCTDQSDEMSCSVVLEPLGYSEKLPPPTLVSPLPISFALNITSVREFDLVSFKIGIDVFLRMQWRDRRLKFANLLANFRANKVKDWREVWTPELEVEDGTKSAVEVKQHSQAAYVLRTSLPLPDDDTTIREDKVYSGELNYLILQKEETLTFKCHFELKMYPFDRQEGPGVYFVGSRALLEYTLVSEELTNYTRHDVSHVKVELVFRNQYGYYIGNTFMPSFMQVIISLATLHFDLADFQDRIMVSLTSLLVLATFFTQTSQTMPKTSYLKLIDVWFVALITEVFAIIMSLVFVETLRLKQGGWTSKVSVRTATKGPSPPPVFIKLPSKAARVNWVFIRLLTMAMVVMLTCFVPICVYGIYST